MHRAIAGLSVSLMLVAAAPALAEEGDVFIGIGGSFAGENFDAPSGVDFDDSRTWTGQLGYRVSDHLAFELEYEQIQDFEFDASLTASDGIFTGTQSVNVELDGFIVARWCSRSGWASTSRSATAGSSSSRVSTSFRPGS